MPSTRFQHHNSSSSVYEEVVVKGRGRPGSEELRDLIRRGKVRVLKPWDRALVEALHYPLGMGESEAIAGSQV